MLAKIRTFSLGAFLSALVVIPVFSQTQDSYDYQSEFTWGINKNNVKGEKDVLTGLRLWWSRTFKKNDEQPEHLKAKSGKPRYDKGEEGMWYD